MREPRPRLTKDAQVEQLKAENKALKAQLKGERVEHVAETRDLHSEMMAAKVDYASSTSRESFMRDKIESLQSQLMVAFYYQDLYRRVLDMMSSAKGAK